jgi:hypothetical protein
MMKGTEFFFFGLGYFAGEKNIDEKIKRFGENKVQQLFPIQSSILP